MSKRKVLITLSAVFAAVVAFVLSWSIYSSKISVALLPDAAESFATSMNTTIESWNKFATENGINTVASTPVILERNASAEQSAEATDDSLETQPTDDASLEEQ